MLSTSLLGASFIAREEKRRERKRASKALWVGERAQKAVCVCVCLFVSVCVCAKRRPWRLRRCRRQKDNGIEVRTKLIQGQLICILHIYACVCVFLLVGCPCVCVCFIFITRQQLRSWLAKSTSGRERESGREKEHTRWERGERERALKSARQRCCLVYKLKATAASASADAAAASGGVARTLTQQARQARQQNYKHKYAYGCVCVCVCKLNVTRYLNRISWSLLYL